MCIGAGASGAAVADAQGRPAVYPLQAYRSFTERTNVFSQSDLVWTHGTDGARRTIVAGLEVGRQDTRNLRETGRFGGPAGSTTLTGVLVSEPTSRNHPVTSPHSGSDAQHTVPSTQLTPPPTTKQQYEEVGGGQEKKKKKES